MFQLRTRTKATDVNGCIGGVGDQQGGAWLSCRSAPGCSPRRVVPQNAADAVQGAAVTAAGEQVATPGALLLLGLHVQRAGTHLATGVCFCLPLLAVKLGVCALCAALIDLSDLP